VIGSLTIMAVLMIVAAIFVNAPGLEWIGFIGFALGIGFPVGNIIGRIKYAA